jgi:hypothetical protein
MLLSQRRAPLELRRRIGRSLRSFLFARALK